MTRDFYIFGDIVDTSLEKVGTEDVCPMDFRNFAEGLEDGDEVVLHINSCGGSVYAGVSISNMVQKLKCRTIARVEGVAASIASVIACSCDELHMGESSFLMVHQVWGSVCGNSDDLRKEAQTMEKMTISLIPFYRTKFDLTDKELIELIDAETWISGADAGQYGLNATIDSDISSVKYAAKLDSRFNIPSNIRKLIDMKNETTEKENPEKEVLKKEVIEEVTEEVLDGKKEEGVPMTEEEVKKEVIEEVTEEVLDGKKEECPECDPERPSYEELEKRVEELTSQLAECQKRLAECNPDETVEERLAKCQSTFQNKINNFKNELKAKDEELQKFKDSVSSLGTELENTKKELHQMSAAFEDKKTALAKLNAGVLSQKQNSTDWRTLRGEQFIKWAESHKDEIQNNEIN